MSDRWLYAWGFASVSLGGASLIVPLYVVALGGDAFTLGLLAGAAAFVGVPGAIVFGRLADRTGKRRAFVLLSLALVTVVLAIVPFVESIRLVIAANAIVWFAFAAAVPVLTLLAVVGVPASPWSARIANTERIPGRRVDAWPRRRRGLDRPGGTGTLTDDRTTMALSRLRGERSGRVRPGSRLPAE